MRNVLLNIICYLPTIVLQSIWVKVCSNNLISFAKTIFVRDNIIGKKNK